MNSLAHRRAFGLFIQDRRNLPFSWAEGRDCCLLGADARRIVFGDPDFAEGVRGYTTKAGAVRALLRANFLTVFHLLQARMRQVKRPRLGTLIMVREPPLDIVYVAEGARACWGQGEHGLEHLPIPERALFWESA